MPISVLPRHLVNKIAAGEVIERPASVVKELVENALDAGTQRIDITVEDGGRKLIAVTDDGAGMSEQDLALAFAPHATSKLADEDDLYSIQTMGFRGEALASIASISHAHIRTRRKDDEGGCEVDASGETVGEVRPCPAAPGTTITVRDLFFNTPARRKFLRTSNTEFGHVTDQLARLALPNPRVAFTLTHNGRLVHSLARTDSTVQRVRDLFGEQLSADMLTVSRRTGKVSVAGLIAPPSAARASGKWQFFFLNGRFIRDRMLSHALREAYRGLIEPGRSPVAFLFVEVPSADVDVNVHPTKIEVRFRESNQVHGELLAALRETLNRANLAPTASFGAPEPAGQYESEPDDERKQSLRQAMADFFRSAPRPQPRLGFAPQPSATASTHTPVAPARSGTVGSCPAGAEMRRPTEPAPSLSTAAPAETAVEAPVRPAPMQVHDAYIVAPVADGLVIIDQHALHERLIYNDLARRLADPQSPKLTGQRLLIPETLEVTETEADTFARHAELLGRLGIEVAPFGPRSVAIQRFPMVLAERTVPPREFLREVLDSLVEDETSEPERLLEGLLSMMACKAAVKAGDPLTDAEMRDLLERRDEAEKASACPHGRPTTLKLTLRELEKQFKRT